MASGTPLVRASTPLMQTFSVPVQNRYDAFQQQWMNCDQTPIKFSSQKSVQAQISQNSHSMDRNSNVSVMTNSFSSLPLDDKLSMMYNQLGKLDNIDSTLMDLSSNLTQTAIRVDRVERKVDQHLLFTKQLVYHSIDDNARARRNNLIFYGLADLRNESCYDTLAQFLEDYMDIDLSKLYIQRVHRLGSKLRVNNNKGVSRRPIIVCFRDYGDTEYILERVNVLVGTGYGVDRDYPKEIASARKKLYEHMKQTYTRDDKCKILYPAKLVVNGKVERDEFPDWHAVLNMNRVEHYTSLTKQFDEGHYSRSTVVDMQSFPPLINQSNPPTQGLVINQRNVQPSPNQSINSNVSDMPNQSINVCASTLSTSAPGARLLSPVPGKEVRTSANGTASCQQSHSSVNINTCSKVNNMSQPRATLPPVTNYPPNQNSARPDTKISDQSKNPAQLTARNECSRNSTNSGKNAADDNPRTIGV